MAHAHRRSRLLAAFALTATTATAGCGSTPAPVTPVDAATDAPVVVAASCVYTNQFSRTDECREYLDPSRTMTQRSDDCAAARGTFRPGVACSYPDTLGSCVVNGSAANTTRLVFPGTNAGACSATRAGCTVFARGAFTPAGVCVGALGDGGVADAGTSTDGGAASEERVFLQPVRECRAPLAGERPGASAGGQVCTWSAISGATEEGRRFQDYGSCDRVRTQRPYYPVAPAPARTTPDARLSDPAYVAELAWVRSQVQSSACVCCHSRELAPDGPANWFIESPGNWVDSFGDNGLALGAGWVDSTVFGAYPPAQNNGFERSTSGVPSTDGARMARFFQQELAHRGRTRESFATTPPFGGPIHDQLVYRPTACTGTDGVAADGTIRWTGPAARYIYVLDEGSANPGVPPNLDLPTGTRWRVDVPPTGAPVASGVVYGRTPTGATQRFPTEGAPQPLVVGSTYYLYVLLDVGIPLTRCTFVQPG